MKKGKSTTYRDAGVDIDAGDALVERIKRAAYETKRSGRIDRQGLGGFGALFDLKATGYRDPILVSSTDGVGTKLKIAQAMNRHDTIGIDLVAMCVNDLVVQGAEPLFFLDYFATGKLSVETAERVIKGIAKGCKEAGCALIGGETAEMPGMYKAGEYDLAGFAVGAVERRKLLPAKNIKKGDVILGLASSGIHSNGYSLVRHIMKQLNLRYDAPAPFARGKTLGEVLLAPTRIYVKSCLKAIGQFPNAIKALAHITGGGLTENIPRVVPHYSAHLRQEVIVGAWKTSPVFSWLQKQGNISHKEMWRTFNCGIGMVMVVSSSAAGAVKRMLEKEGEVVYRLGALGSRDSDAVVIRD